MSSASVFLYEGRHFARSPFKVVALLLFVAAAVYGLHSGADLYRAQTAGIAEVERRAAAERQEYLAYYDQGKPGPEDRPWVNMAEPFWALWYANVHHFKTPSPAMVYSVGQAEQYGFYKKITYRASPYDADMAEEIANPERLQTGTLDFAFAVLFLLPLLLLILLYNLKSAEAEQGFLPLVEVQAGTSRGWLLARVAFYAALLVLVLVGLFLYGAVLTPVFTTATVAAATGAFGRMLLLYVAYLLLWTVGFYLILWRGTSIIGNTLRMAGCWLLLAFVVPGAVHQWVSIEAPPNLMTDFIDVRDEQGALYDEPDSVVLAKLRDVYPDLYTDITRSTAYADSTLRKAALRESVLALVNELRKASVRPIEAEARTRNALVARTFWFNPVAFFQNRANRIAGTHFDDYHDYRTRVQVAVDALLRTLVLDTWRNVQVDRQKFREYEQRLTQIEKDA